MYSEKELVTNLAHVNVQRGIKFLKRFYPDFQDKLQYGFNISSTDRCVLTLSTGRNYVHFNFPDFEYDLGFELVKSKDHDFFTVASHHGFTDALYIGEFAYPYYTNALLQRVWEDELNRLDYQS